MFEDPENPYRVFRIFDNYSGKFAHIFQLPNGVTCYFLPMAVNTGPVAKSQYDEFVKLNFKQKTLLKDYSSYWNF